MDRGTNIGVAVDDVIVTAKHSYMTVDVRGADNHGIVYVALVTTGSVALTNSGEVIIIMHQNAHHGKNKTINSSPQLVNCKNNADDRSIKVGGNQHMSILDNYKVPMSIRNALSYITLRPHTGNEWETLPHVIITSDKDWDLIVLDCEGQVDNYTWFDAQ